MEGRSGKVALIHPDLGIGGAERLVVDAALEMSALGYEVRSLPLLFFSPSPFSYSILQTVHNHLADETPHNFNLAPYHRVRYRL